METRKVTRDRRWRISLVTVSSSIHGSSTGEHNVTHTSIKPNTDSLYKTLLDNRPSFISDSDCRIMARGDVAETYYGYTLFRTRCVVKEL